MLRLFDHEEHILLDNCAARMKQAEEIVRGDLTFIVDIVDLEAEANGPLSIKISNFPDPLLILAESHLWRGLQASQDTFCDWVWIEAAQVFAQLGPANANIL